MEFLRRPKLSDRSSSLPSPTPTPTPASAADAVPLTLPLPPPQRSDTIHPAGDLTLRDLVSILPMLDDTVVVRRARKHGALKS